MTAMFPSSGVPAIDAKNTIPDPNTVNCEELWYSTSRCQPRFDPAAANAVLSELINLVNCAGIPYDCNELDNLCTAVRYLIQGGDSNCVVLAAGPNDYTGALDPPLIEYPMDCCMVISVTPNVNNDGNVRINLNGLGDKQVLRNDGLQLKMNDWKVGIPTLLAWCGGRWINISLLPSQLPRVLGPNMILYVNAVTGHDTNYDGTAATVIGGTGKGPYKTIQRAVDEAFTYGPSAYTMRIEVSAGTYPEAIHSHSFQGPSIFLNGAGRQQTFCVGVANAATFTWSAGNLIHIENIYISTGTGLGPPAGFVAVTGASLSTNNTASGYCAFSVWEAYSGYISMGNHDFTAGSSCGQTIAGAWFGGSIAFAWNVVWTFLGAISAPTTICGSSNGSVQVPVPYSPVFVNPGYVTAAKYVAAANGVISVQGLGVNFFPGNTAGYTSTGGQYL